MIKNVQNPIRQFLPLVYDDQINQNYIIVDFLGEPTLQAVGNQLVNENQDIFFEFIVPVMEKQFAKLFKDVGDAIVDKATIDELFPDIKVGKN